MRTIIVLLALVCVALCAPARPRLSTTFQANINITTTDNRGTRVGKGVWAADWQAGKSLEHYEFDSAPDALVYDLDRADLGHAYVETVDRDTGKVVCHSFKTSDNITDPWKWIENATYIGVVDNVNAWHFAVGYANLTIGVTLNDANTPVWLKRTARGELVTVYGFSSWSTSAPDAALFNVPSICSAAQSRPSKPNHSAACVPRDTAIAHAKVWVANKVPYNQGATYQGYREDCSGYVSMAWESAQPGHTTETMHEIASPISKAELQPGDCLLYAAEHVVLFGGWTSSAKTEYTAYEETKPGEGTVSRATPYPYWYSTSDFLPYRFNNICN